MSIWDFGRTQFGLFLGFVITFGVFGGGYLLLEHFIDADEEELPIMVWVLFWVSCGIIWIVNSYLMITFLNI